MTIFRLVNIVLLFSVIACGVPSLCLSTETLLQKTQPRKVQSQNTNCLCNPVEARNVGQLLLQSNVLIETDRGRLNTFVAWINDNARLLTSNGPTITCVGNLGSALVRAGLRSFNRADYDSAYGSVLAMGGTINQANEVTGSMMSGSLDAVMMGTELLWLARVIPPAAAGNWNPYQTTGTTTRNQIRQIIPILQMTGMSTELQQYMPVIDQFGPIIEEQMVMAGCLFRR